jgi:hypothetical protein
MQYSGPGDSFDNATLRRSKEALEQAQGVLRQAQITKQETMQLMSNAQWCDVGDHPFSAKDKQKRSITVTQWDDEKQHDVEDLVMCCGPCSRVNPLIQRAAPDKPVPAAAIGAPSGKFDPEYTANLERGLGMNEPGGTGPRGSSGGHSFANGNGAPPVVWGQESHWWLMV